MIFSFPIQIALAEKYLEVAFSFYIIETIKRHFQKRQ